MVGPLNSRHPGAKAILKNTATPGISVEGVTVPGEYVSEATELSEVSGMSGV